MVGIRSPDGLVVGSCTCHPGVLGSIPKREEPGKTGRHPVFKYRVPHGSQLCIRYCSNKPQQQLQRLRQRAFPAPPHLWTCDQTTRRSASRISAPTSRSSSARFLAAYGQNITSGPAINVLYHLAPAHLSDTCVLDPRSHTSPSILRFVSHLRHCVLCSQFLWSARSATDQSRTPLSPSHTPCGYVHRVSGHAGELLLLS
jgi:hypothetical protein